MKKILTFFLVILGTSIYAQTQPSSQPTGLGFLGIKAYGMSINFTLSDASHYLILRSQQPITGAPTDGVSYLVGEYIGNAKVLAIGANSFYTFREAVANTKYYFAVFAFNDGANPNYINSNPLTSSVTTLDKTPGTYYDNYRIDKSDAIQKLGNLLYSHSHELYYQFDNVAVENLYQRDTVIGGVSKKYVVCEYSDEVYDFDDGNFSASLYNKEHVLPKSWMPPGNVSPSDFPGSDYHNLFLVKASVNAKRYNHPQGDIAGSATWTSGTSSYGKNSNNVNVFEPKDDIKGNVARTMFYTMMTYHNSGGYSWAFDNLTTKGPTQDVDVLLQWHQQDPVDNFEIARNEFIYSKQNNRNPFVDHPEWVKCFDFKTMTLSGNCPLDTADITKAIVDFKNSDKVLLYPNPVNKQAFVKLAEDVRITELELLNINGQKIAFTYELQNNVADIDLSDVKTGFYFLKVVTSDIIYIKRISKM